ncbi:MAG: hypothetical protein ABUT39_23210 [Acidobacteriota bacterium]
MRQKCVLVGLVIVLLLSLSPLMAADNTVIKRGIDVFTTTANGKTFYDFARNPIPAGFFCEGSAAYTGRVLLRGLPLETETPGQLRGADTVIERLDDAAFDANGTAVTRIRFRALSLVSISPIRTSCGAFHVYVTLAGKQRVTAMSINRTHERGGSFFAPLAVDARMTFVPVKKDRSSRKLELIGSFTFPGNAIPWSLEGGLGMKRVTSAVVDTNGDLKPDTRLFGTTNFAPGWSPDGIKQVAAAGCTVCEPESCGHIDPATGHQHCTGPVTACYPYNCP